MNDMDKLQNKIVRWQNKTFTESTAFSKLIHLKKEINELSKDMSSGRDVGSEIADCQILLFGIAGKYKKSCYKEATKKLEINKKRKWGKPDKNGVVEHID